MAPAQCRRKSKGQITEEEGAVPLPIQGWMGGPDCKVLGSKPSGPLRQCPRQCAACIAQVPGVKNRPQSQGGPTVPPATGGDPVGLISIRRSRLLPRSRAYATEGDTVPRCSQAQRTCHMPGSGRRTHG